MNYDEWLNYNEKNKIINIDNIICYTFIWEHSVDDKNNGSFNSFINKVYYDNFFKNLSYEYFFKIINDQISLYDYKLDKDLIKSMFYSKQKINEISFFFLYRSFK